MIKKYFFALIFCYFLNPIQGQIQLSKFAEISIVTAGPGSELFEAFGHSAIRIKDPVLKIDIIYNYGVFDFNTPNFYSNFAKGNLIYSLARYDFKYFLASYQKDKRWLKQQILQTTQEQNQAFFKYLENNAISKNKNYSYDPYFNNCASILRDITKLIFEDKVVFTYELEEKLTLRQLTNNEIHWNSWGTFGLNLIAGTKLDKEASIEETMYLPDYLYSSLKNAKLYIRNEPENLVKREDILLNFDEKAQKTTFFSPLLIFSSILIFGLFITFKDVKKKKRTKWFDFLLFFTSGIIGVVLVFLWFFSTHSTAPNNFNILWAFAPNLVVAFLLLKKYPSKWMQKYVQFLLFLLVVFSIIWLLKIQVFPVVVIPLLILFVVRYIFLSKKMGTRTE